MVNNPGSLDAVFAALSDPTRRRIVERLARGPLTVGEIAAEFPISQPAISRHVCVFEESGELVRRVVGCVHICTLAPDAMNGAAGWIDKQTALLEPPARPARRRPQRTFHSKEEKNMTNLQSRRWLRPRSPAGRRLFRANACWAAGTKPLKLPTIFYHRQSYNRHPHGR